MAEIERLQRALRNAHNAGDTAAAQRLAGMIRAQQQPAAEQPSTFGDVARSFASGAARGAMELIGLPATIGQIPMQLAQSIGLVPEDQDVRSMLSGSRIREVASELTGGATEYRPETTAGEYARTVGEFLPGLITPGGAATRIIGGVVAPAIGSETAGQAARAMNAGETGEGIARLAGALSPMALSSIGRRVISPTGGVRPERLRAAEVLREADIPVSAGQVSGSGGLRAIEGTLQATDDQLRSFTRAALRNVGSNADSATEEVLTAASNRIGKVFNDVTKNLRVDPTVSPIVSNLRQTADNFRRSVGAGEQTGIIDDIAKWFDDALSGGTQISPREIMEWRSSLSAMTASGTPEKRRLALEALEHIDDIISGSLTAAGRADDVARLGNARNQWRDYLAIERAAAAGGASAAEGILSPSALRQAVQGQSRRQYVQGSRGDIGNLSRAAQAILTPAPTTLSGGVRVIQGTGRAATTAIGAATGGAGGAIVGMAAPEMISALANTRLGQAYLGNQLLGRPTSVFNPNIIGPIAPASGRLTAAQRAMLYGPAAMSQGQQR